MPSEDYVTDELDDNETVATVEEGSVGENGLSNLIEDDPYSAETVQTINDLMSRWKLLWPIPEGSEGSLGDGSSVFSDSVATFSVTSSINGPTPDKNSSKAFFTVLSQEKIELKEIHSMLETCPTLLRTKMKSDRRLPLHVACARKFPPINFSDNVLDCVNSLVTDVTDLWSLLRTIAVSHTKGCSKPDKSGDLPVHLLARNFLEWEEEWKILISPALSQLRITSSDIALFTRLYQTIAMCIDLVLQPIISNKELIRVGGSVGNMLPLHIAATFGVSFDVFQQILERYPGAAAKPCELTGNLTKCDIHNATPLDLLDRTRSLPLHDSVTLNAPADTSDPIIYEDSNIQSSDTVGEQNDSLSTRESSTSLTKESTQPMSPPNSKSDNTAKNESPKHSEEKQVGNSSGTSAGAAVGLSNFLESSKPQAVVRAPIALNKKGTVTSATIAKPTNHVSSAGEPKEIPGKPTVSRASSSASTDASNTENIDRTQMPAKQVTEETSASQPTRTVPVSSKNKLNAENEEQRAKMGKAAAVARGLPAIAEEPPSPDKQDKYDNATKEAEQIMQGLMSWWDDESEKKSTQTVPPASASVSLEDQKANLESEMRRASGLSNEQIEMSKETGFALEFALDSSEFGSSERLGSNLDARTNARTLESFDDDSEYAQSVIADDLQSIGSMASAQALDLPGPSLDIPAHSYDASTRPLDTSTHTEVTAEIDEDIARIWNRGHELPSIATPIGGTDAESFPPGPQGTFRPPQKFASENTLTPVSGRNEAVSRKTPDVLAMGNKIIPPGGSGVLSLPSGSDKKDVVFDPYEKRSIAPVNKDIVFDPYENRSIPQGSNQKDINFDPNENRDTAQHVWTGLNPSVSSSDVEKNEEAKEMETELGMDNLNNIVLGPNDIYTEIVPLDTTDARSPEQSDLLLDLSGDDNRSLHTGQGNDGTPESFDQEFQLQRNVLYWTGSRTCSRRMKVILCAIPVMIVCTIAVSLGFMLRLDNGEANTVSSLQGIDGEEIQVDSGSYQGQAKQWVLGNSGYSQTRMRQRYALACLYYSTYGVSTPVTDGKYGVGKVPEWLASYSWLSNANECTWLGVSCNSDFLVTAIQLPKNRLTGGLPSELSLLADTLEHLDVSDNMIYNEEEGNAFFGKLKNLNFLHIRSNDFVHEGIPTQIGLLTKLTDLDVSYTLFKGPLQGEVFRNLTNLTHLSIGGNAYNSSIPREIGELPRLRYFYADNAFITGDLSFIEPMENIYELWIDKNPGINGTLPTFLGDKTSLGGFSATECNLQGSIPSEIGKLPDIELLWFYSNQLTGEIPSELGNLTKLRVFEVQHNSLNGAMPSQVCSHFEQKEDVHLEADCVNGLTCSCCTACHRGRQ